MKKIVLGTLLFAASSSVFAVGPGGSDCGWGNMLFEGKSGLPSHSLASTFNDSTGNNTLGMTSGTNGCSTNGVLTYGGDGLVAFSFILDEFTEDVAKGKGEALSTVAVMFRVEKQDRPVFAEVTHANFNTLFPNEQVTAEEVLKSLVLVMKNDPRLAKYVI